MQSAEFFAGAGLVRRALESAGVYVAWANDIDPIKSSIYSANYGPDELRLDDIANVHGWEVPTVDLATASFPCTDVSLAGNRAGLEGGQSGTFWHFIRVLDEMGQRKPSHVLLENVPGLGTSQDGRDLVAAIDALNRLGYSCDLLQLDARYWVPQSRARVFIVGTAKPPLGYVSWLSSPEVRPRWMDQFRAGNLRLRMHFVPLRLPLGATQGLETIVQPMGSDDHRWWNAERLGKFTESLSEIQSQRLSGLRDSSGIHYRTAYRRTRFGRPVWEIRSDELSGCLRTARGGSSKQALVKAGRGSVMVRWMVPSEYARLMGADAHDFSAVSENQALFALGDAVCIPALAWLVREYLVPLAAGELDARAVATA